MKALLVKELIHVANLVREELEVLGVGSVVGSRSELFFFVLAVCHYR